MNVQLHSCVIYSSLNNAVDPFESLYKCLCLRIEDSYNFSFSLWILWQWVVSNFKQSLKGTFWLDIWIEFLKAYSQEKLTRTGKSVVLLFYVFDVARFCSTCFFSDKIDSIFVMVFSEPLSVGSYCFSFFNVLLIE